MAVEKAAVNENNSFSAGENEVGAAGKTADVQAVSVAEAVDDAPDGPLGSRILVANARHALAALSWGQGVHGAVMVVDVAWRGQNAKGAPLWGSEGRSARLEG